MNGWTVHIEAAGDPGTVTDDALDHLATELDASVTGTPDGSRYGATFSITADTLADAQRVALLRFSTARMAADLPDLPIVHLECSTWAEADRQAELGLFPNLVGITELAELAGVTRQRASALSKRADFPAPLARLASGPVWPRPWVDRFIASWSRAPGRPPAQRPGRRSPLQDDEARFDPADVGELETELERVAAELGRPKLRRRRTLDEALEDVNAAIEQAVDHLGRIAAEVRAREQQAEAARAQRGSTS